MKKDKTLQIPVDANTIQWVNKGQKEVKAKSQAEFVRMVLTYHMEADPVDFKTKAEKAKIDRMLREIESQAQLIADRKEQLEKQREKLEV